MIINTPVLVTPTPADMVQRFTSLRSDLLQVTTNLSECERINKAPSNDIAATLRDVKQGLLQAQSGVFALKRDARELIDQLGYGANTVGAIQSTIVLMNAMGATGYHTPYAVRQLIPVIDTVSAGIELFK